MTWTIGLGDGSYTYPILDALTAGWAWDRLTERSRTAVADAYGSRLVIDAHPNTLHALYRHGFLMDDYMTLTDPGWAVARWMRPRCPNPG